MLAERKGEKIANRSIKPEHMGRDLEPQLHPLELGTAGSRGVRLAHVSVLFPVGSWVGA